MKNNRSIAIHMIIGLFVVALGAAPAFAADYFSYDGRVLYDVKRDRIMAIAEDFFSLSYYMALENTIPSCTGTTCPDPEVGWKTGTKYCWGGENTTKQYLEGLALNLAAGNRNTGSSSGFGECAVGNDCSGFVSTAWTSPRYATSGFSNISTQLTDWNYLRMGDALNNSGSHIRLFDYFTDEANTAMLYESTGTGWRMQHRSLARNDDYVPIRYNHTYKVYDYPEPVILYITRNGTERAFLRWDGEAVTGFRLYVSTNGTDWTLIRDETQLTPAMRTCEVSGLLPDMPYYFRMTSINSGNVETIPSDVTAFCYDGWGWDVRVLLVDGADRYRQQHDTNHEFMIRLVTALASRGIGFNFASNESIVDSQISALDYEVLIWMLNEESTFDETFSWPEQMNLRAFLENGGALFASGSEVGWDIDYKADSTTYKNGHVHDRTFYQSYLRSSLASSLDDDAGTYHVQGVAGTIFAGLDFYFDDGSQGTPDITTPDVITPINGSISGLAYVGGRTGSAAVYDSKSTHGTVVYMGFPFESIYPEAARNGIMKAVINYFEATPVSPTLKSAVRADADSITITWDGYAAQGFLLSQKTGDGAWAVVQNETILGSDARSATVTGLSALTRYAFKVQAKGGSALSADSDVLVCSLPQGNSGTRILIVDGYDRWNSKSGGVNHSFLEKYAETLNGYRYDSCTNESVADGTIVLGGYDFVIWMCGDESTESETFGKTEQTLVEEYLKAGGNLFVSGSEIGWDLVARADTLNTYSNGDPNDTPYYNNILKADFVDDSASTYTARAVAGSLFDGITLSFDNGTHETYDVEYADVIGELGGSSVAMYYGETGTNAAAVTFSGTLSGGTSPCRIIYMGFPFETIYSLSQRQPVMTAILGYMGALPAPAALSAFGLF